MAGLPGPLAMSNKVLTRVEFVSAIARVDLLPSLVLIELMNFKFEHGKNWLIELQLLDL